MDLNHAARQAGGVDSPQSTSRRGSSMPFTRKLIVLGAVLAVAVSGIALAETAPGDQRMLPAWVQMANGKNGLSAKACQLPNGELLIVTATNPKEVQHIRGLGFIGLLANVS